VRSCLSRTAPSGTGRLKSRYLIHRATTFPSSRHSAESPGVEVDDEAAARCGNGLARAAIAVLSETETAAQRGSRKLR